MSLEWEPATKPNSLHAELYKRERCYQGTFWYTHLLITTGVFIEDIPVSICKSMLCIGLHYSCLYSSVRLHFALASAPAGQQKQVCCKINMLRSKQKRITRYGCWFYKMGRYDHGRDQRIRWNGGTDDGRDQSHITGGQDGKRLYPPQQRTNKGRQTMSKYYRHNNKLIHYAKIINSDLFGLFNLSL